MPIIAHFNNAADAAFVQSLLTSEGIEATILDGSGAGILSSIHSPYRLEVHDSQMEAAREITNQYALDNPSRADRSEAQHPAKGFPFLGIFVTVALISGSLLFLIMSVPRITDAAFNFSNNWRELFSFLFLSIAVGMGVGLKISIIWLIVHIFRNRKRGYASSKSEAQSPLL